MYNYSTCTELCVDAVAQQKHNQNQHQYQKTAKPIAVDSSTISQDEEAPTEPKPKPKAKPIKNRMLKKLIHLTNGRMKQRQHKLKKPQIHIQHRAIFVISFVDIQHYNRIMNTYLGQNTIPKNSENCHVQ